MRFIEEWRNQIKTYAQQAGGWLDRRVQNDLPPLVYGHLAGLTLLPVADAVGQAIATGQPLSWSVGMALGGVLSGVGGNLVASRIEQWASGSTQPSLEEIVEWAAPLAESNADFRIAVDKLLTEFEVIQHVQASLTRERQVWFLETLQTEMRGLNSTLLVVVAEMRRTAEASEATAENTKRSADMLDGIQQDVKRIADRLTQADDPLAAAVDQYLRKLLKACNQLTDLVALSLDTNDASNITLDQVYIALNTTEFIEAQAERGQRAKLFISRRDKPTPLPMLTAAAETKRLVILGDPGSGKSIFVNHLAAQLAAARLHPASRSMEGWSPLIPIVVTIRDLGPQLSRFAQQRIPASRQSAALRKLIKAQWQSDLNDLGAGLLAEQFDTFLEREQLLLIFDGLDEIGSRLRPFISRAIQAFDSYETVAKIIVTCRIRSYPMEASKRPLLPTFTVRTIAPFTPQQIGDFVTAWYQAVHISDDQEKRTKDLQTAATGPHLIKLAENPMLLTTMALIHQSRAELPRQRVRLYAEAVEILLLRWQKARGLTFESHLEKAYGAPMAQQLTALLEDRKRVRRILERLGYEAHLLLKPQADNADLARKDAINILEQSAYLGSAGLAELFLDYVDHRAGLLVGRGGNDTEARPQQYRFPHRTFLEYLAGCYLVHDKSIRKIKKQYQQLLQEGNDWYVAAQLGAEELLHNNDRKDDVLELTYRLGRKRPSNRETKLAIWRSIVWAGYLAVQLGAATLEEDIDEDGAERLACLRADLVMTMQRSPLPIGERAEAGRFLAQLGDPRQGVGYNVINGRNIPDIVWGGLVPAGEYLIGDNYGEYEKAAVRTMTLTQPFQLSRYPITYSQFECFVTATDFDQWWLGLPNNEKDIGEQTFKFANHPRETISWYQAIAFCRWLSDKLDIIIDLPHEHEWEVAARYPHNKRYPWGGDGFDLLKANTFKGESVNQTTAVGMYPSGKNSELDLYDMSGNVWEWCRNKYRDTHAIRVDRSHHGRTLRGGSWLFNRDNARAASRAYNPYSRYDYLGFRVCVRRPPS